MGTRCQVKIEEEGMDYSDKVTLYHHWDGYPSNMLMRLKDAEKGARDYIEEKAKSRGKGVDGKPYTPEYWQLGRAGKAASFICKSEPDGFEPESSNELHGDIEWYYVIHLKNKKKGYFQHYPEWTVDVYDAQVHVNGSPNLIPVVKDVKLSSMTEAKAKKIEKQRDKISEEAYKEQKKEVKAYKEEHPEDEDGKEAIIKDAEDLADESSETIHEDDPNWKKKAKKAKA
jgi:hypothetical protein